MAIFSISCLVAMRLISVHARRGQRVNVNGVVFQDVSLLTRKLLGNSIHNSITLTSINTCKNTPPNLPSLMPRLFFAHGGEK